MVDRAKLRFLRRVALTGIGSVSVPLSGVAVNLAAPSLQLPSIDPTQVLRIIAGVVRFQDAGQSGKLTLLGTNAALYTTTGNPVRAWSPGIANVVAGLAGITFGWIDDEYVYGTDYLEILGANDVKGSWKVICSADISNSDGAAAHVMSSTMNLLVELYQLPLHRDQ